LPVLVQDEFLDSDQTHTHNTATFCLLRRVPELFERLRFDLVCCDRSGSDTRRGVTCGGVLELILIRRFRAFQASLLRIAARTTRVEWKMMHTEKKEAGVVVVARKGDNGIKRWRLGA
jgi:hypothetical protein